MTGQQSLNLRPSMPGPKFLFRAASAVPGSCCIALQEENICFFFTELTMDDMYNIVYMHR